MVAQLGHTCTFRRCIDQSKNTRQIPLSSTVVSKIYITVDVERTVQLYLIQSAKYADAENLRRITVVMPKVRVGTVPIRPPDVWYRGRGS